MKKFDTRVYSVSDFVEWNGGGLLDLSPEFQRRSVWSEKAKSYLIDTLLRGKPIPKILITQALRSKRNVRVVVDGQQRLRAILEFIDDGFRVSRMHNDQYAGKSFSTLPDDVQRDFLKYEVGVDLLFDTDYSEILDIFARLNTYSVRLNPQEQLNAKYLGYFKQSAYKLGYDYVNYWIGAGILTKPQVARMGESQLASDLLVALLGGVQTNKNVATYYKRYEDNEGDIPSCVARFNKTMSMIGEVFDQKSLKQTNFRRIHLFYSLFCAFAHCMYGLKGLEHSPRPDIIKHVTKVRVRLDEVSSRYDEEEHNADYGKFVDYSRRATTDTSRRIFRSEFICKQLSDAIGG